MRRKTKKDKEGMYSHPGAERRAYTSAEKQRICACISVSLCLVISFVVIIIGGFYGRMHGPIGGVDYEKLVTVETGSGTIVGFQEAGVNKYLGIPYAQPPVGDLRWKSPQPVTPWKERKSVKIFGPACPQLVTPYAPDLVFENQNEDCLFLNIWTPSWVSTSFTIEQLKLPVMVWIHGGGFMVDDTSNPIYDGSSLASRGDVVVVTLNYRLQVFGFLALDELQLEDQNKSTGNYGIADMQLALKWVQLNIAKFGGNPNNVLLFGESSGGHSTLVHLASSGSKGLFHSAIIESGWTRNILSLDRAVKQGRHIVNQTNCTQASDLLSCLRKLPVTDLLTYGSSCTYAPVIDRFILTDLPELLIGTDKWNKVPIIMGATQDEGTTFLIAFGITDYSEAAYVPTLNALAGAVGMGEISSGITELYSLSNYANPGSYWGLSSFLSDATIKCSSIWWGHLLTTAYPDIPFYLYEFAYVPTKRIFYPESWGAIGAFHGAEIPYVWNAAGFDNTPQALELTRQTQLYWTQFAKNQNPNSPENSVEWPRFNSSANLNIVLNTPVSIGQWFNRTVQCQLFEPYLSIHNPAAPCAA